MGSYIFDKLFPLLAEEFFLKKGDVFDIDKFCKQRGQRGNTLREILRHTDNFVTVRGEGVKCCIKAETSKDILDELIRARRLRDAKLLEYKERSRARDQNQGSDIDRKIRDIKEDVTAISVKIEAMFRLMKRLGREFDVS